MNGARFKGLLYFHGLCFKIAGLCICFSLTPVITWDFSNSAPPVWEGILVNCQDATRTRFLLVLSSSTNPDNSFTHQQILLLLPSSSGTPGWFLLGRSCSHLLKVPNFQTPRSAFGTEHSEQQFLGGCSAPPSLHKVVCFSSFSFLSVQMLLLVL